MECIVFCVCETFKSSQKKYRRPYNTNIFDNTVNGSFDLLQKEPSIFVKLLQKEPFLMEVGFLHVLYWKFPALILDSKHF